MKLIVGLGNPGTKYEKTRHNIGFSVVERFLKDFEPVKKTVWTFENKFKSDIVELEWQAQASYSGKPSLEKVLLVKPKTYMNNSGLAVQLLTTYYKLLTTDVWIVHDELDLPLGTLKIRMGGSSAGHKGVESLIQKLGTEKFWRFRLGIGEVHNHAELARSMVRNVDDYVLGQFAQHQTGQARRLVKRGANALKIALEKGIEKAQNQFN